MVNFGCHCKNNNTRVEFHLQKTRQKQKNKQKLTTWFQNMQVGRKLILEKRGNDLYRMLQKVEKAFVTVKKLKNLSTGPAVLCSSLMPKGSVCNVKSQHVPSTKVDPCIHQCLSADSQSISVL